MNSSQRRFVLAVSLVGASVGLRKLAELSRRDFSGVEWDRSGAGMPLRPGQDPADPVIDARIVARVEEPEWVRDLATWVPAAPRTPLGRALAILWALPSSVVGVLLGLLSATLPTVRDGVLLFAPVRGPVRMWLAHSGFAASTLGHVVLSRSQPTPALMAHELVHTRQAERLGPLMGPVYGYYLLRYGYVHHPMERAARIAGRQARHEAAGHRRPSRGVRA